MSTRDHYPAGVPCWVESMQPDVEAALDFYGSLFGWEFAADPSGIPGDPAGKYFVARRKGLDVAGIGSRTHRSGASAPAWTRHIRVDRADQAAKRAENTGGTIVDGPLGALSAGRLAVIVDPAGARFGVWEAGTRAGAQLINEPRTWALSSLRTTDPEGSKAFYTSMFGWRPETLEVPGGHLTLWRLPGYVGGQPGQGAPRDTVAIMSALGGPSAATADHPHWTVDFYCDDAAATADEATRMGGRVIVPVFDNPGFRRAVLADAQGATFTVTQQISGA